MPNKKTTFTVAFYVICLDRSILAGEKRLLVEAGCVPIEVYDCGHHLIAPMDGQFAMRDTFNRHEHLFKIIFEQASLRFGLLRRQKIFVMVQFESPSCFFDCCGVTERTASR